MKIERLGSPTEFARAVVQLGVSVPEDHVLALVEAAFYASLQEEEARHAAFSIAWEPQAHACKSVIAIATPVAITPKNLAKLAPATRLETTAIAVRHDGERLVAWALLEEGPAYKQPFTIRVLGSGVLRVDAAGTPRALYARGETYLIDGVKSPAALLARTFEGHLGGMSGDRAARITRIAARVLDHGHGGMLLITPAGVEPVGVRIHYRADVIDHDDERLARLSAIDNAVLLDTDLRLRGFGVQVIEGDAPQMEFDHTDPYSTDVHVDDLSTFKGTRHPAGVIFCMRQPGAAAAIIVSQDARLSLAVKTARGVEVLGSYERAFGWLC